MLEILIIGISDYSKISCVSVKENLFIQTFKKGATSLKSLSISLFSYAWLLHKKHANSIVSSFTVLSTKGKSFFGTISLYCLFDLVHSDIRYDHQISDKYGQHTGNANWRCKGQHAEVSCFYSYHYIFCIYLSINNHCLENATFDPLNRHCSSENSITY
jgi:hypothetical protein